MSINQTRQTTTRVPQTAPGRHWRSRRSMRRGDTKEPPRQLKEERPLQQTTLDGECVSTGDVHDKTDNFRLLEHRHAGVGINRGICYKSAAEICGNLDHKMPKMVICKVETFIALTKPIGFPRILPRFKNRFWKWIIIFLMMNILHLTWYVSVFLKYSIFPKIIDCMISVFFRLL